jgi:hypothetical protein
MMILVVIVVMALLNSASGSMKLVTVMAPD